VKQFKGGKIYFGSVLAEDQLVPLFQGHGREAIIDHRCSFLAIQEAERDRTGWEQGTTFKVTTYYLQSGPTLHSFHYLPITHPVMNPSVDQFNN
jgi:hypothetical protein